MYGHVISSLMKKMMEQKMKIDPTSQIILVVSWKSTDGQTQVLTNCRVVVVLVPSADCNHRHHRYHLVENENSDVPFVWKHESKCSVCTRLVL